MNRGQILRLYPLAKPLGELRQPQQLALLQQFMLVVARRTLIRVRTAPAWLL